jgi:hypothetical protein
MGLISASEVAYCENAGFLNSTPSNLFMGNLLCINRLSNEIGMRISNIDVSIDSLFKMMTQINCYVTNRELWWYSIMLVNVKAHFAEIWHRPSVVFELQIWC